MTLRCQTKKQTLANLWTFKVQSRGRQTLCNSETWGLSEICVSANPHHPLTAKCKTRGKNCANTKSSYCTHSVQYYVQDTRKELKVVQTQNLNMYTLLTQTRILQGFTVKAESFTALFWRERRKIWFLSFSCASQVETIIHIVMYAKYDNNIHSHFQTEKSI